MDYDFTFAGVNLSARASGALFWPEMGVLVVSDLHLGKSERLARRGGALLPPYETRETLLRLDQEITQTQPRHVVLLGDSFDDATAFDGLDEADRLWLTRMMAGREWTWIAGNHDSGPLDIGGTHRDELTKGGLRFRHIAQSRETPEISGHYHPKASLAGRNRPCFLIDPQRIILPAFGAYTGGLSCMDPVFDPLMGPGALAVLTGKSCLARPMRLSGRPS